MCVSTTSLAATDLQTFQRTANWDLRNICGAVKLFKLDAQRFPTESEGLAILLPSAGGRPTDLPIRPDGYLQHFPMDPWGRAYVYIAVGSGYRVLTYGADGVPGGRLEDADIIGCDLSDLVQPNPSIQSGRAESVVPIGTSQRPAADFRR